MFSVVKARELEVGLAGAQEDEAKGSRASTLRGDAASKQLCHSEDARTALHALRPRGIGARDPHRVTVASHIHFFLFYANYSQKLN